MAVPSHLPLLGFVADTFDFGVFAMGDYLGFDGCLERWHGHLDTLFVTDKQGWKSDYFPNRLFELLYFDGCTNSYLILLPTGLDNGDHR